MINQDSPNRLHNKQSIANRGHEDGPFAEGADEISLLDILDFIKKSYKIMMLCAFLGLLCGIGYLLVATPMYEATAQIRMAQISQVNPTNPFGVPIEDPASLISRLQFPTNYPTQVISACGYEARVHPGLALSKDLKVSVLKGVANTIELKVLSPSPQVAADCANAVFSQITIMQELMSKPFVEEAKTKLSVDNERIEAARRIIAKADQSGSAMSAAYLSARDELTYFLTDREKMADLINSVKNRGTSLVSPIYVVDRPVSPKKRIFLLAGLFGGLLLGLLAALAQTLLAKLRSASGGSL